MPAQDLHAVAFPMLDAEDIEGIAECPLTTHERYREGDVIVDAGDRNFQFYVVAAEAFAGVLELRVGYAAGSDREMEIAVPLEMAAGSRTQRALALPPERRRPLTLRWWLRARDGSIPVLDHVVAAGGRHVSLAERGPCEGGSPPGFRCDTATTARRKSPGERILRSTRDVEDG